MRLTLIIGYIFGIIVVTTSILITEDTSFFLDPSSLLITGGGTLAALLIHFTPRAFKSAGSSFKNLFDKKQYEVRFVIEQMVGLSKEAKRSGIHSILANSFVKENSYLEKGLMLVADGESSNEIEETLTEESITITETQNLGEEVFRFGGSVAPSFGMMGTVIGLIAMLNRVDDPESIPPSMGLALVTTLYGLIMSALFFKPTAGKIRIKNAIDSKIRNIEIQGILSIQNGDSPQLTREKLSMYL